MLFFGITQIIHDVIYMSGAAEGRRRLKRAHLTMTRRLFSYRRQTEFDAIKLPSCGRRCTFVVFSLATPQNFCISRHTTDRQKFWRSRNGKWCLRR